MDAHSGGGWHPRASFLPPFTIDYPTRFPRNTASLIAESLERGISSYIQVRSLALSALVRLFPPQYPFLISSRYTGTQPFVMHAHNRSHRPTRWRPTRTALPIPYHSSASRVFRMPSDSKVDRRSASLPDESSYLPVSALIWPLPRLSLVLNPPMFRPCPLRHGPHSQRATTMPDIS